ncbi:fungal pheromone STE3G-protein-coupled receptor [Schizopora paradoxa]|uniref:Fungal pheromone STE3G-protein-coupled receptor n=1 Tax=Schizopora paradoxa TaxID=27342 RepID=A0A0H2RR96_9AGAM|nr:fungal pheromone STE3G-protein-coupled receptor [Schizopora paradoxa]
MQWQVTLTLCISLVRTMHPYTPYPLTPIGSFIGFVLSVIPLASHLSFSSWNTGIWMYAIWIGTMNITYFVDTIVWHDNVDIVIPVWCDIVTKLQLGAAIGVPACTLVLCIHLFKITQMRALTVTSTTSKVQRRRVLLFDLLLTIGLPICVMGSCIVVQPYRFEIIEEIGCQSAEFNYVTFAIIFMLSFISAALSPFTLRKFIRHRDEINENLQSNAEVTPNKYIRVMAITCLTLFLDMPVVIIVVTTRLLEGHESDLNNPYRSWSTARDGSMSKIAVTTAEVWGSNKWLVFTVKWNEWIYLPHAIVFFTIFGTTPEARRRYRSVTSNLLSSIGLKKKQKLESSSDIIVFGSNTSCEPESCIIDTK